MILILVRLLPGLSYILSSFCRMYMYDMYVWATTLVTPDTWCRPVGHYAIPTLLFNFICVKFS